MSDDENFELIRRFNQSVTAADLSVLDELVTPDFVVHGNGDDIEGRDAWRQFIESVQAQAGEMEAGIDELIGNGDLVGERWWIRGADGTRRGITMHRIEGGKLAEDWVVFEDIPPTA